MPEAAIRGSSSEEEPIEWAALAQIVREKAASDGGATPVSRMIKGRQWIAFHEAVLDEVADDHDWYFGNGINEPMFVIGSGAICALAGHEDEALVRLAGHLSPFREMFDEMRSAAQAADELSAAA